MPRDNFTHFYAMINSNLSCIAQVVSMLPVSCRIVGLQPYHQYTLYYRGCVKNVTCEKYEDNDFETFPKGKIYFEVFSIREISRDRCKTFLYFIVPTKPSVFGVFAQSVLIKHERLWKYTYHYVAINTKTLEQKSGLCDVTSTCEIVDLEPESSYKIFLSACYAPLEKAPRFCSKYTNEELLVSTNPESES